MAGTASADSYRGFDRGYDRGFDAINQTERDIALRIDQGVRNRALTGREAGYLRGQLNDIERLEASYRSHGLSRWERADLVRRLDALSARTHFERHDRDYRGDRHPDRHGW
jgi:hypothetical protein